MKNIMLTILIALILIIIISSPLGLSFNQGLVVAGIFISIIWWTTETINKNYVSVFLLLLFTLFGDTPVADVFQFPLSENFIIIVVSFLFSQGILNSGLADKLLMPILFKFADNIWKLMCLIFAFALIMVFIIPQPFSRIIILSLIFSRYFDRIDLDSGPKEVLNFCVYLLTGFINMFFIKGDIILNNAIMMIASQSVNDVAWAKYMFVPTFIFSILATTCLLYIFREDLKKYNKKNDVKPVEFGNLSGTDKKHLILILLVVILWATETFHGINGTLIVIIGTLIMFGNGLLRIHDIKSINIELLVFLTAVFSIGEVMRESGIADIIFSRFVNLLPGTFSMKYVLIIVLISIGLHMVMGSNITTMSVAIPGFIAISKDVADPVIVMFIMFVAISAHYVLPYQRAIILLGEGSKHYSSKTVLKFAPYFTFITIFSILFVYLGWWKLIGLM